MKRVAITQSNYIPWKGYFDLINNVDEFILYDDMQYTRRDWRNRNKIKTPDGVKWLTIPVEVKGKYFQKINETKVVDHSWRKKHWLQIVQSYKKAKYFSNFEDQFYKIYSRCDSDLLSEINYIFIQEIATILGIDTTIRFSSEFKLCEGKSERLLSICKACNATEYYSGPAAQGYLDEELFEQNDVAVKWMNYSGYPEYEQLYPPFDHNVTILDLIFNMGENAKSYMKSFHANK